MVGAPHFFRAYRELHQSTLKLVRVAQPFVQLQGSALHNPPCDPFFCSVAQAVTEVCKRSTTPKELTDEGISYQIHGKHAQIISCQISRQKFTKIPSSPFCFQILPP